MVKCILGALASTVFLSGCGILDPDCHDVCGIWAEVRGTVQLPSGARVADAEISFRLMIDGPAVGGEITCSREGGEPEARVATDPGGEFSVLLQDVTITRPDCVELTVVPPPDVFALPVVDTLMLRWSLDRDDAPIVDAGVIVLPNVQ